MATATTTRTTTAKRNGIPPQLNGRKIPEVTPARPAAKRADEYDWLTGMIPGEYARLGKYLVGVVSVTPEASAKVIAEYNRQNRRPTPRHVSVMAKAMKDCCFQLNGETLVFDTERNVRNGQHRLLACVEAGTPFETFVVAGLPPEVFASFDQHARRTLAQVLAMRQEANPKVIASAITYMLSFQARAIFSKPGGAFVYTLEDLLALLDQHPGLRSSSAFAAEAGWRNAKRFAGAGQLAGLHYLLTTVDADAAGQFFRALIECNVPLTPPWSATRLLNHALLTNQSGDKREYDSIEVAALTVKAWNALREGKAYRKLMWGVDEAFPRISGWAYPEEVAI